MTAPRTEPVEENEIDRRKRIRYNLQVVLKDASKEERDAYVQSEMVKPQAENDDVGASLRSLGQGLSFNFGDEIEAGVRSVLPGKTYKGEKEKIDQNLSNFRNSNPGKAFALEMGGGLLSGGAIAKTAGAGLKGASAIAKLAGTGAAAGALAGAGATDGSLKDRAVGGGLGGALGGALGWAASPAIQRLAGTKMAQKVGGVLKTTAGDAVGATSRAITGSTAPSSSLDAPKGIRSVARTLANKGSTADAIQSRAAEMMDVPESRIVDVSGEAGARDARGIRTLGGKGGATINEALDAGHAAQRGSVESALTQGSGRENAVETIDDLIRGRELRAAPFYEAARRAPPMEMDDELSALLASQPARRALGAAKGFPEYSGLPDNDMKLLDKVYKYVGDAANEAKIAGRREQARDLNNVRTALKGKMVKHSPDYGEALSAFSSESELIDAMEAGRGLFSGKIDPREIAKMAGAMGDGEREFLRRGAADGIMSSLDEASDHLDVTKRLATPAFRERVRAVWGDEADGILSKIGKLRDKAEIRSVIQGGSQTADKISDVADAAGGKLVEDAVSGGWPSAVTKFGRDKVWRPMRAKVGADERALQAGVYAEPITNTKALGALLREMERQRLLKAPSAAGRVQVGRLAGTEVGRN